MARLGEFAALARRMWAARVRGDVAYVVHAAKTLARLAGASDPRRLRNVFSCLGNATNHAVRLMLTASDLAASICFDLDGEAFALAFVGFDLSKQVCEALGVRSELTTGLERLRTWKDFSDAALAGSASLGFWWTSALPEAGFVAWRDVPGTVQHSALLLLEAQRGR